MKKIIALTLAMIMMMFALAACGEKEPNPSGNGTSDPGTSQQTPSDTSGDNEKVTFTDGEWPDNKWTENIPEPPFAIGELDYDGGRELVIHFSDVTYDAMVAYSDEIAKTYDDATVISSGTTYKWRTNVNKDGSVIWTIGLETKEDGTGFMTIKNMQ